MDVRLLRVGDLYAVFHQGEQAGVVRRETINGRRMWRADGPDGRRGVFSDKRTAARWLAHVV